MMRRQTIGHASVGVRAGGGDDARHGATAAAQVKTTAGRVEGTASADGRVRVFKGIPFAAAPIGERRWKAPAPVAPWTDVKKTVAFGPRCAQGRIFGDMIFRDEMSEDCLYLNVWTPAAKAGEKLPVMFWIHGGGFQAGSASEPRQDGEQLARKGVVVVIGQPPARRVRVSRARGADEGIGPQRVGQLRPARSGGRARSGCTTTSRPLAATRATSRSSASRPGRLR